ncbi:putative peptide modification system cyclase [Pseudoxanthomonas daejeonensis]|uniref:putative peptide modification system cyclase n=1 Tax=Pseudoxanthomonas daejeonensis TaxID=266062 RepID=UPI001F5445D4|nr:putative peptide modification system cyclase [Pseudoxanthomonas daejeonensis]UNK58578.1 putative peptide modification system cyclase [Pseudoxanthomonas daejeonensis]
MPHDAHAPQLRTLLLTDLCDSTSLVERLGDSTAATLFRDHDRLVLELQQRWRGRLIDRSDGLLLLFERPLDGLGFALDYRRGLDALGQAHRIGPMLARAGLHVGEVLIWRNSDEAISAGAKPIEVEGLAKPFAARLMQLARPGQILISSITEPLVRRASRELGERGEALHWRTHGRWYFKGLPEIQEVHEVGEPGLAPLRAPRGDAKARRDIPAWRRPIALAAELAVVSGLVVGGWFMTRPEPAIAFSERDWVVVGDLRNLTGQTVLDDSLEQAFRISLEQSRYVNVLSDLKVRDSLARMRRPADTTLDRTTASEVAIRDGARAVILPTVSEVGGKVRVSLELIDPTTAQTIYSASEDGAGLDSVLTSIDGVTSLLRSKLGEGQIELATNSKPLPQVSTRSLDALRAYALGQEAYGKGEYEQARGFYGRAISLDPEFALAHLGVTRALNATDHLQEGLPFLRHAQALRQNLTPRDQVYLDSWGSQVDEPQKISLAWMQMAKMYPDFFPAQTNAAYELAVLNEYAKAEEFAARAVSPQSEFSALSSEHLGRMRLARDDYKRALEPLKFACESSVASACVWKSVWNAAQGNFTEAEQAWPPERSLSVPYFDRVSIYLDQGKWSEARVESERLVELSHKFPSRSRQSLMPLAVALWSDGDRDVAIEELGRMVKLSLQAFAQPKSVTDRRGDAMTALYAAIFAQRLGDTKLAAQVEAALAGAPDVASLKPVSALAAVMRARRAANDGKPKVAIEILQPLMDDTEPVQARVALMEAHMLAGNREEALANANWLASHRGRSYGEYGCSWCQQPLNVVDSRLAQAHIAALKSDAGDQDVLRRRMDAQRSTPAQVLSSHSDF